MSLPDKYFKYVFVDNGIFSSICLTLLFNSFLYDLTPDSFNFSFISFSTRLISDRIKLLSGLMTDPLIFKKSDDFLNPVEHDKLCAMEYLIAI